MSAGKKRIDQFPTIVKENSTEIRQYQDVVSEFIGIFKEQNVLHELKLQVPEATVAKLLARLCGKRIGKIGWKKRRKSVSPSSGGCQRRESGAFR